MEVSGSAAAYESNDNMGKEKKEEKKSSGDKRIMMGIWGSESESDDDYGSEEENLGQSESDCEDPMDPIWDLIYEDDSCGLMKYLNLQKDADGNHCDPDYYEQLKYAFESSCYLNKLVCLQALLDSGVDWFNAVGEEHLLHDTCIKDTKNAAQLIIEYAKKKNVADKLLGATDGHGMTPLHVATFCGSWNVMQLLLDQGADPCKRDATHKLPCDYANPGTKARKLLVNAVLNKV